MLKAILIIEINRITHVKHLGRLSGANLGKNWYSGRLTFGRKNKSMGGSRNITCTHNIDYDMMEITGEGKFI